MQRVKILKIIGGIIAIIVVILCIFYLNFWRYSDSVTVSGDVKSAQIYTKEEVDQKIVEASEQTKEEYKDLIQEYMAQGKGTLAMLRALFEEEIVVQDKDNYIFVPIEDKLEKHEYHLDGFVKNAEDEIQYYNGDKSISKKGIDVSKYQGEIDWDKVKADGVEFAYIRLGFRGYESGALALDEQFINNIKGATNAGIEVGVYFFSQAINEEEAVQEADFVISNLKDYELSLPIVFDTEEIQNDTSRTQNLTVQERTNISIAFCEAIKDAGYEPIIYANLKCFTTMLDLTKLEEYDKWLAQYENVPYFPYKFNIWQYTESGTVDGIDGFVDLNILIE